MNVILIPGFWLDATIWDDIAPGLREAGHEVRAVTLPGLGDGADPTTVRLQDQVDAVVALVDDAGGPVVLVGHSGGGPVSWGAADARPDRVARVVFVDSFPLPEGGFISNEWEPVDGVVPLPDRSGFEEGDLRDMTDELWAAFRARAIPEPGRVPSDPIHYTGDAAARRRIPVTLIATGFPGADVRGAIEGGHPFMAELREIGDVSIRDLPTGHWPQLTKPAELTAELVDVLRA
jgi:pimeloyl-ACP methyl ester carboxylesterase